MPNTTIGSNTNVQLALVGGAVVAIAAGAFQAGAFATRLTTAEETGKLNRATLEQVTEIAKDNKRRLDLAEGGK